MILPDTKKWRDVKSMFVRYGVKAIEGKSKGHRRRRHPRLQSPDGRKYTIPARRDSSDISRHYIEAARRHFGLTAEDGVPDEEFYGLT